MTQLQSELEQRLQQLQAEAVSQIEEQEAKFRADAAFQQLAAEQQAQVLEATTRAKADVKAAAQPGRVSLRLNRYRQEDVPKQLQRIAALAAPPDSPAQVVTVVPASGLAVHCPLSQITTSAELEQWLGALRAAAQAELDRGHRISL